MTPAFIFRPEEFEQYRIGENTVITFCMRELRAILSFAESMNISMTANFDTAGKYEKSNEIKPVLIHWYVMVTLHFVSFRLTGPLYL